MRRRHSSSSESLSSLSSSRNSIFSISSATSGRSRRDPSTSFSDVSFEPIPKKPRLTKPAQQLGISWTKKSNLKSKKKKLSKYKSTVRKFI